jgi:hypothetical protein
MNLTISPLIRVVALVGLVGIVVLGGSVMMLGRAHKTATPDVSQRHGSATPSRKTTTTQVKAKPHVTPATPVHTAAKPKAVVKTAVPAPATHAKTNTPKTTPATVHKAATPQKTATKHKVTTHKPAKTTFHGNAVYADLPAPLQWQLAHHKVVVVSLYNPNADVDAISVAEAHAGATSAGAGFLLVSVLNNKVAGILTALLPGGGLLPEPGVLVYRAPGTIAVRMDGFSDRDSVAQAAANALLTPAATTPATSAAAATITP